MLATAINQDGYLKVVLDNPSLDKKSGDGTSYFLAEQFRSTRLGMRATTSSEQLTIRGMIAGLCFV